MCVFIYRQFLKHVHLPLFDPTISIHIYVTHGIPLTFYVNADRACSCLREYTRVRRHK